MRHARDWRPSAPAPTALRLHGYRWYRDYAPLYPQVYYGPPVVYVVPPAYAYYPRPVYRACCGYVVGPAGTYYPRAQYYPRQRYVTPGTTSAAARRCCY